MLKSYFTMAWRSLLRNKIASAINIGGLTVGLAVGIIILLYVMDRLGANGFNKHLADIHLVMTNQRISGNISTDGATPIPLGPAIRKEIPSIDRVARTRRESFLTRYGSKSLYQQGLYADPDLFNMLTLVAIEGDPVAALKNIDKVVLTQSAAQKFFGRDNALGKTIILADATPLTVGAIIRDLPTNSTFQFDMVLPFARYENGNTAAQQWSYSAVDTWIQLAAGAKKTLVDRELNQVLREHYDSKTVDANAIAYFAYPLDRMELYGSFKDGKPDGGKIYLVEIMAALAGLVLLVACVNFMNLSTAMAERRAREVGLRKVLGASRPVIMGQFLGESLLLAMIALVLSIPLVYTVLPWFIGFSNQHLEHEFGDARLWVAILIVGVCTGLISGSYPALYLSRFQPVKVLKRIVSLGWGGARFRRALVTFQFVIAIFLVIGSIVCIRQIRYVASRPIGYQPDNLIDIGADGNLPARFDLFKQQVAAIPGVVNVTAGSDNLVRNWMYINNLDWPGKRSDQDIIFRLSYVQYDWSTTTGVTFVEGRDFSPAFGSDTSSCLINQTAVQRMGLKGPVIGARVGGHRVIGIIKDYVINDPAHAAPPLIVYLTRGPLSHFLVRLTNDGQWKTRLAHIEAIVKDLNPHYPFSFTFTNETYEKAFVGAYGVEQIVTIFGGMAIFISCMGLFGFAGFIAERRKKEISIRKVLGATGGGLWLTLSREFLKPVVVGLIIAIPLGVLATRQLLALMDYRIQLSWWIFAVGGGSALLIALATVSYHGIRAARQNPVSALTAE